MPKTTKALLPKEAAVAQSPEGATEAGWYLVTRDNDQFGVDAAAIEDGRVSEIDVSPEG